MGDGSEGEGYSTSGEVSSSDGDESSVFELDGWDSDESHEDYTDDSDIDDTSPFDVEPEVPVLPPESEPSAEQSGEDAEDDESPFETEEEKPADSETILAEKSEDDMEKIENEPPNQEKTQAEHTQVEKEQTVNEQTEKEEADVEHIKTRNESLGGDVHPVTGVPFESVTVTVDGREVEAVVPRFDSEFDAQLPENLYTESDHVQNKECNAQLKEAVDRDPELAARFDEEQLEQIADGETPDGYTWHHDAEAGKMQLVNYEIHQQTGHTGGRNIWGGGTANR